MFSLFYILREWGGTVRRQPHFPQPQPIRGGVSLHNSLFLVNSVVQSMKNA